MWSRTVGSAKSLARSTTLVCIMNRVVQYTRALGGKSLARSTTLVCIMNRVQYTRASLGGKSLASSEVYHSCLYHEQSTIHKSAGWEKSWCRLAQRGVDEGRETPVILSPENTNVYNVVN